MTVNFMRPVAFLLMALAALVGAVAPASAMKVERVVSPGGIEAWLVRDPSVPVLAVNVVFRPGSAADPAGKEGLSEMTAALMDEGAGQYDSTAFQGRLEDLAGSVGFEAGVDTVAARLRTTTLNRDAVFEMLRLALIEPRFDAEPVERVRGQILVNIARSAENPDRIAARTWWSTMFPDHPYGRQNQGTQASVQAITIDDLKGFVRKRFARDNMIVGVSGDITAAELGPLLDRTLGALPARSEPVIVAEAVPAGKGGLQVVQRPIAQSVVLFGHRGVKRNDADYYPLYVMNYVLGGGGFSSRLYTEVRDKRGLAYSVYSYLNPLDHAGVIQGGVGTQNARVKESIDLIREEWRRVAAEGVTAEELADAKTFLTGSYYLRLDSTRNIAAMLTSLQLDGLGIDYLEKRNGFIEKVTLDDVKRVAKRWLAADDLFFVVVGSPEGLGGDAKKPG